MKKLLIAATLALSLVGCANLQNAYNTVTGASVSPTAVYVAANSFDAVEVTATNYLRLKKCSPSSGPVCRDPAATAKIIPAVRSGRVARNNLLAFMKANPGQLGPVGLYNALTSATQTLQQVEATYGVSK